MMSVRRVYGGVFLRPPPATRAEGPEEGGCAGGSLRGPSFRQFFPNPGEGSGPEGSLLDPTCRRKGTELLRGTLCEEGRVLEVFWWASFPLSHVTDRQQDAQTSQGGFGVQGLLPGPLTLQVRPALPAPVLASGPVGGCEREILRPPRLLHCCSRHLPGVYTHLPWAFCPALPSRSPAWGRGSGTGFGLRQSVFESH